MPKGKKIYYRYNKSAIGELTVTLDDTDFYDIVEHVLNENKVLDKVMSDPCVAARHDDSLDDKLDKKMPGDSIGIVVRYGRLEDADELENLDWEAFDKAAKLKEPGELTGNLGEDPNEDAEWAENPVLQLTNPEEKNLNRMCFIDGTIMTGVEEETDPKKRNFLKDLGVKAEDFVWISPVVKTRAAKVEKVKGFLGRLFCRNIWMASPPESVWDNWKPGGFLKNQMRDAGIDPKTFELRPVKVTVAYFIKRQKCDFNAGIGVRDMSLQLGVKHGKMTKQSGCISINPGENIEVACPGKRVYCTMIVEDRGKCYLIEKDRAVNRGMRITCNLNDVAQVQIKPRNLV